MLSSYLNTFQLGVHGVNHQNIWQIFLLPDVHLAVILPNLVVDIINHCRVPNDTPFPQMGQNDLWA